MSDTLDEVTADADAGPLTTLDLPLDPPIELKSITYSVIKLREPRVREVREAEAKYDAQMSLVSSMAYHTALIASVSGIPAEVLGRARVSVMNQAGAFLDALVEPDLTREADAGDVLDFDFEVLLKWNKQDYPSIRLREPTQDEARKARAFINGGTTPETLRRSFAQLVQSNCGLPPAVVDGMLIRDFNRAVRFCSGFLAAGRTISKS